MVESSMEEENEIGLPPRFTPQWPPAPVPKPTVRNVPGCSMVFRKSSWPPPTDDNVISDEENGSGGGLNRSNQTNSSGSTDEQSNSNSVKPPKAVRDYSSFFGKNQKPLIIPVRPKSVQPDAIALPEAFTGNPDGEAATE